MTAARRIGRLRRREPLHVRWHHQISVRLAIVVAVLMLASAGAFYVYWFHAQSWLIGRAMGQDVAGVVSDDDPRLAAGADGGGARDENGQRLMPESEWLSARARYDRIVGFVLGTVGVLVALTVGWVASRRVTRHLRELALAVQTPVELDQELPGPFRVATGDEIGVLATAMNHMRARIQDLVASLDARDRDRRHWIALVSHDLRNPLQALTACLDRAAEEALRIQDSGRRTSMQRLLGTARLDVDRFEVMTQDLLDIARLEAEDPLLLEPVPPGELARNAVDGMRVLAEAGGRRLQVKVAPGLPELAADGRRMLRALENLLRNAIQHASTRVDLVVEREGADHVRFAVLDDGPGLPVEPDGLVDVSSLGTYKSRDDSAGLGLVVARRVAEAHGGRIGAGNRAPGEGVPSGAAIAAGTAVAGAAVWISLPERNGSAVPPYPTTGSIDDEALEE